MKTIIIIATGLLIATVWLYIFPKALYKYFQAHRYLGCRGNKKKIFGVEWWGRHRWKVIDATDVMPDNSRYVIRHCQRDACGKIESI